eukprot:5261497-Heterocapsa_arctica.AAC.1
MIKKKYYSRGTYIKIFGFKFFGKNYAASVGGSIRRLNLWDLLGYFLICSEALYLCLGDRVSDAVFE